MQTTAVNQPGQERHGGPILLAFNGSPASGRALSAAAQLLTERRAMVLVVWKSGLDFELLEIPSVAGPPPAPIDIRTALEIDEAQYQSGQRLARRGAGIAVEAEALVVAEDPEIPLFGHGSPRRAGARLLH